MFPEGSRLHLGSAFTLPRMLHPGAWWLWALGMAAAASRTSNPLLLLLLIAVSGYVVSARRTNAPWSRSYVVFLKVALLVVAIRVVFQSVFGAGVAGRITLFTIPAVPIPDWMGGLSIGGPVTAEAVAAAAFDGLRLGTILICVGAANALANPKRLLQTVPGALYELGVAVVVAMTFAPQLLVDAGRARAARRLRGQRGGGLRAVRETAVPVLEGALERSVSLAAAMDSRGYGRTARLGRGTRRLTGALTLLGLLGICAGAYGLLDAGSPALLGMPTLLIGAVSASAGLALGGRRTVRTRYRPDPWALPEWSVALAGLASAACFVWASISDPGAILISTVPLTFPTVPALPLAGALVALAPAWLAPPIPKNAREAG